MTTNTLLLCILVVLTTVVNSKRHNEPVCTSRFDYDEKMLEKMVRLEHSMELLQARVDTRLAELDHKKQNFQQTAKTSMEQLKTEQDGALSSLYEARSALEKLSLNEFMGNKEVIFNRKITDLTEFTNKQDPVLVFSVINGKPALVNGVPTFNTVLTNEGTAYDVKTGVFTTPYDGIYMFTFNIRSKSSTHCFCYFRINKATKGYAISEGSNNMGSVTVYFKLQEADKVDLGNCLHWNHVVSGGAAFSGQLIHRL